ncbi:Gfo/Idh/MocA family oxidoreductase [Pendulispora brunnea]|uniref:Gfo/Idh/MocA family oxidoreductase n=1 Tax=Pendulispora brunnea TaxID=2905690 RepID=A0ABZ2K7Q3_9BACT
MHSSSGSSNRGALIVGAGAAGLLHGLSFRAHGVPVLAVYDPDRDKARRFAELVGGPRVLDDLAGIDQNSDIGCVSICSPPLVHVEQAERCAGPDRLLFVEKPVAMTRDEMLRLEKLPFAVPIVQWRAGRAIRTVRRAIAEGLLGPTPSVAIDLAWHRDARYFSEGRDRYDLWGCGALLSVGIHALDAVCFALDRPIAEVHGTLGYATGIEVETRAALDIAFRGGALASLRITFDAGMDQTRLTFCGAGVTATIAGSEADPTANPVEFIAADPAKLRVLQALEDKVDGVGQSPLLVPFIGRALESFRQGMMPGASSHFPSVRDVAIAHAAIFRVYEGETRTQRAIHPPSTASTCPVT